MSLSDLYRKDFNIFKTPENEGVIYLDNAATAQRPQCVIDAISDFYNKDNANPLRGLYGLSVRATDDYENSRAVVGQFINSSRAEEIIFTRNASESLNLVAYTYGMQNVKEGDEIVISCMEHHSNILPWQMVCKAKNAKLVWLECDDQAVISKEEYESKITSRTKIVSIAHVSNVFGITNPVKEIAEYAHKVNPECIVVVDGAQSTPHMKVDVQALGADFLAFSGHKLCGPMGIGALYGRMEILEKMQPFLRGGEMIEYVTREDATYAEVPHKFEAGTVNASGAVGLAAAIKYIESIGLEKIEENDNNLAKIIMEGLAENPFVHVIGNKDYRKHCGIVTFTIDGVHPHDISSILDSEKIAIRAGHHCAQPLMQKLGVGSTARASCYFYNTEEECRKFVEKVGQVRKWMGYK
ncbi:SufS family cysteine desulfurase [Treponema sp.]|uniref:aminotransferase class V-fold PLP-dependent enzyme n=1 Tax=Treponema sp. TaxID=166 RepID=UPI00298E21CA|nr:SufS family cysteine desulfurase [Treponema sp.]MCQ2240560.1 SufS family cysteine desulfurase [Treponema sp.]